MLKLQALTDELNQNPQNDLINDGEVVVPVQLQIVIDELNENPSSPELLYPLNTINNAAECLAALGHSQTVECTQSHSDLLSAINNVGRLIKATLCICESTSRGKCKSDRILTK